MAMMTVYRQAPRHSQALDHLEIMKLAVDPEALDMILFARQHGKPTLVALAGGQAVIKPQEAGDDGLSFESLYDVAISIREYRRMVAHKVTSVEEIPPALFEVIVSLTVDEPPRLTVRMKAKSDVDVKTRLKRLVSDNADFREELIRRLVQQTMNEPNVTMLYGSALRCKDAADPTDPEWEFVDD